MGQAIGPRADKEKEEAGSTFVLPAMRRTPCSLNISPSRCLRWQLWAGFRPLW